MLALGVRNKKQILDMVCGFHPTRGGDAISFSAGKLYKAFWFMSKIFVSTFT